MYKILLVGGTGFFGKSLLSFLQSHDCKVTQVYLLSRSPEKIEKYFHKNTFPFEIKYVGQDVLEPIKVHESVDYIIHAAAESSTSVGIENPMLMRDVVVEGTRNVLEYAHRHKVKRVLFISSGSVYGKQPNDLNHIPEDYTGAPNPLNPLNAYGCAKRQAENLCALYHHQYGVDYVIARCFAFIGPYLPQNAHFAIGNFIRDGINGGPIVVKGDGTTIRSYLYADDLAEWLWTILRKGKSGEAYNVGSDKAITIGDLAHIVSSCFEPNPEVIIKTKQSGKVNRYVPDVEKVKTILGVSEKIALIDGIKRTINFYQKKIYNL